MVYVAHDNEDDLIAGTRKCRACSETKRLTDFHLANGRRHRRRVCKSCCEARRQARRIADPVETARRDRAWTIRRKYGITEDEFDALLAAQGGRCAICAREIDVADASLRPHIDHDHQTGAVRGVLCFTCNTALGKFRDSTDLLMAAVRYLEAAASKENAA